MSLPVANTMNFHYLIPHPTQNMCGGVMGIDKVASKIDAAALSIQRVTETIHIKALCAMVRPPRPLCRKVMLSYCLCMSLSLHLCKCISVSLSLFSLYLLNSTEG